jgi:PAS domain S-box-containing protein
VPRPSRGLARGLAYGLLAGLTLPLSGCSPHAAGHSWLDLALVLGLGLCLALMVLCRMRSRVRSLEDICTSTEAGQTRARLAGVLRAASRLSVIATDRQGIIRVFNSGAEHMLGYSADELVGKTTPERLHLRGEVEEYGRELSGRLGRPVAGFEVFVTMATQGGPQGFDSREWTYVRKDGGHVPVHLTVTAIYGDDGSLEGFLGIGLDLSARKALEADLRQAQVSVDNAGDMILWARADDARLAYANKAACDALGYTRGELTALRVMDVNPTRTLENWREHCRHVRAHGRTTVPMTFRRKDGTLIPVESTSAIVEHGGADYAIGIIRDITLRKAAEENLRRETRLNRALAETARSLIGPEPDMAALAAQVLDHACELTGSRLGFVSSLRDDGQGFALRTATTLPPGGACAMALLSPDIAPGADGRYPGPWGRCLNERQGFYDNDPDPAQCAAGLPEGHEPIRRMLAMPAVIKDRVVGQIALANPTRPYSGDDLDLVASLADIFALGVEQIHARRALLDAKEEAEASSRAKSEFLANMTHEVRTPLNGILGMLQVLQNTPLSPEQRDYADVALESAERLNLLLGNVIEYAGLDQGGLGAQCLEFPPTDLLRSLEAEFGPQAAAKGLAFSTRCGPGLPELIRSDPQALRQILAKLLDNALKFTPAGHVALSAAPQPDSPARIQFRVEDSGIGIPPEQRQQVFEAFVQADAGITRTFGGAGLGLAIARKLATGLGGGLETQDRPGGGTVMLLTVPADCEAAQKG